MDLDLVTDSNSDQIAPFITPADGALRLPVQGAGVADDGMRLIVVGGIAQVVSDMGACLSAVGWLFEFGSYVSKIWYKSLRGTQKAN